MRKSSSSVIPAVLAPNAGQAASLYRQLYNGIRDQVLRGHFAPGQKMPSTRVLAADLGVSRNTVLNAFDQLKAEGYLEGLSGSGTYVARALPDELTQAPTSRPTKPATLASTPRLSAFGERVARLDHLRARSIFVARPFQAGVSAIEQFPYDTWARITNRQWKSRPSGLLPYSEAAGYLPLRRAVADYLRVARAVRCDAEQVIIVSGSQQAIDLSARLLLNPGDPVLVEDPAYSSARAPFEAASARLVPAAVDSSGINVADAITNCVDARLIYTTPCNNFPLGSAMDAARRLELLDWAARSNARILEDDYDSEFRYSTRPLPALQSLDQTGSVIYFGTFSKVLFPALRLGYVVPPPDLIDEFIIAKSITDRHAPTVDQAVVAEFITEGHFARHIRRMRALYLERLEEFVDCARRSLPEDITVPRPDAGMHALALFPEGWDDCSVAKEAISAGISCSALSCSFMNRPQASLNVPKTAGLILGFAAYSVRQTRTAMKKLAAVVKLYSSG